MGTFGKVRGQHHVSSSSLSALFLETGTVWNSFIQVGCPAVQGASEICLSDSLQSWNCRPAPLCPAFTWMPWIQGSGPYAFCCSTLPQSLLLKPYCFIIGIMQTSHRSQSMRKESRIKFEFMIGIHGQTWSEIEFI